MFNETDPENIFSILETRFNVSRETFDRLTLYLDTLIKWQKQINLISSSTIPDIWSRHLLDSIQLLPLLPFASFTLGDIGSGGGFPGMVLAIACPHAKVTLIESDQRKIIFLQEILRLTGTSSELFSGRVESLEKEFDVITARGCADLGQLLTWGMPLMKKNAKCLFLKGKNYTKELEEARRWFRFESNPFPSLADKTGIVLEIQNISRVRAS